MRGKCEFSDDCPVRRRRAQARRLMQDPKRKGELGELVFVLTAASHGLIVSKPYGDSASYDFLVQAGRRLRRIQVKAAFTERKGAYCFNVTSGRHRYYTEKDIDFLAAYIAPIDLWYIVPVRVIRSTSAIVISPGARLKQRGVRFEPYREAWRLLTRRSPKESKSVTENDIRTNTREETALQTG
jgi:PD-(D/E)XK endonuclease